MKTLITILILLAAAPSLFAQDGSDMRYIKTADINEEHVGAFAHLDFGERSFDIRRMYDRSGLKEKAERIDLTIKGVTIRFFEHRVDDGLNNWFKDQYLESDELVDGLTLRIPKFRILKVLPATLRVLAYFTYLDAEGRPVSGPLIAEELELERSKIVEVLIKADK